MFLEIFEGIRFIKVKKYYLIGYFLDLEMIQHTQLQ